MKSVIYCLQNSLLFKLIHLHKPTNIISPASTIAIPVVNIILKAQIDQIAQPDILQHNDFFNLFLSSHIQFACLITLLENNCWNCTQQFNSHHSSKAEQYRQNQCQIK